MTHVDWKRYRVEPGQKVELKDYDPHETKAWDDDKDDGKDKLDDLNDRLETLQELLYAQGKHRLLIVLQGMDTAGKDSTIRRVFEGVNPQGVRVASFKVPTPQEMAHDYLWRIHKQVPGNGEIVIFNRSHYEDVLVVRVHKLVPPEVWSRRYDQINDFEKMLAQTGTTILKFFLHISRDEQRQRLLDRLDEPAKNWKFNPDDLKERELWDDYQQAYEDALQKTSTKYAPWFVVPANRKWYRDLIISSILVETLDDLKMEYPKPAQDLESYRKALSED